MQETNYNTAVSKLIEAARILLETNDENPSLSTMRIAMRIDALACEVLASGLREQGEQDG